MRYVACVGWLVAIIGVGSCVAISPGPAFGDQGRVPESGQPRLPHGARVLGPASQTQHLHLDVGLKVGDPAALQRFATAVSTPGSSQYGHYLTSRQFARRFGSPPARIRAVQRILRREGLRVASPTADHLLLRVTATVGQAERAFATPESRVRLRGGRIAFANTRIPTLPRAAQRDVVGVFGLDDTATPRPLDLATHVRHAKAPATAEPRSGPTPYSRRHVATGGPQPCYPATAHGAYDSTSGTQGYTADEIASAYGLSSYYQAGDEGAGQTIALTEYEGYDPTDIAAYAGCYQVTPLVTPVTIDGAPDPTQATGEAALDIEQIIGLAPKANILVYQTAANFPDLDVLDAIVSQDRAQVISNSYGLCEPYLLQTDGPLLQMENAILQEAATHGQSFFTASGDAGAEDCYEQGSSQPDYELAVDDPAGQPYATAVGGTSMGSLVSGHFPLPTNGSYPGEFVWNDGLHTVGSTGNTKVQASASGGGTSNYWPMPAWQSNAAPSLGLVNSESDTLCGGQYCREVPDVAADADYNSGYVVYFDRMWEVNGGTSASAPLWAAFALLANASPACRGLSLGFLSPALYQVAGSAYATNFHDVSAGSPFTTGPDPSNNPFYATRQTIDSGDLYTVGPNYDMTTGLGSMVGNVLGPSLCATRAPVYSVTVASPGNQVTTVGSPVQLAISGSDSGRAGLAFSASGLPAGLTMNAAGVITGVPTTLQTTTVTVSAADGYNNGGSTQFSWSIAAPPAPPATPKAHKVGRAKVRAVRIFGLTKRRPKLTFAVVGVKRGPALKSLQLTLPRGMNFARGARSLKHGVVLTGGRKRLAFRTEVRHKALIITLRTAARKFAVRIERPTFFISPTAAAAITRHLLRKLTFKLAVTDVRGTTVRRTITLRKLRN